MKFPAFSVLFTLAVALLLPACTPKPAVDEATAFLPIHENVNAMEKKDVARVMATVHPQSPVYAGTKEVIEDLFKHYTLKMTLSNLKIVKATSDEVQVSFDQTTEKLSGPDEFQGTRLEGIHTLRQDKGEWKIFKTVPTKVSPLNPG